MAKSVMPNGHLIAFEIDPSIAQIVRTSMGRNGLNSVANIIGQGAGSQSIDKLVTVDQVVQKMAIGKVRFLKVDTDGSDYDVLVGATGMLRDTHPVVVVEMSEQKQDIFDLLCGCGYKYFIGQNNKSIIPPQWPENLVASTEQVKIPERGSFFL
jgi:hypothetical protein